MRSAASTSPSIFAADGKAIATARCRSKSRIDTTYTRTGSELSRFKLECGDDSRNRSNCSNARCGHGRSSRKASKASRGRRRGSVRIDWFDVFIRHIPHRMASTTARGRSRVGCETPLLPMRGNLPPEEEGVPFDEDFTIYCNPFPIVDRHLTIAHREHGAQRIANQFGNMLDLAAAPARIFRHL